jgi:hypothetical protein
VAPGAASLNICHPRFHRGIEMTVEDVERVGWRKWLAYMEEDDTPYMCMSISRRGMESRDPNKTNS